MIRAALLVVGLTLAGFDIAPPAAGVIVELERVPGHVTRRHKSCADYWHCPGVVVDIKRARYVVHYEWTRGWSGRSACEVEPGVFARAREGQEFRCKV